MPLTPVLPENKNTLDARIGVNLKTNGTQFITAEKLRSTLKPIVNSTFGLKTIWAGSMYIAYSTAGVRNDYSTNETYYDPYYFPPVQDPGGALALNSLLNKYQVISKGSGLRVNSLANGSFTNIPATLVSSNNNESKYGGGLTFDGTIEGGILSSLTVNNSGAGYADGVNVGTYLELQLDTIGEGVKPKLKFNLYNTIYPANNNGGQQFAWVSSATNVFIPNIADIFPSPPPSPNKTIPYIQMCYSDVYGDKVFASKSLSRGSQAVSDSTSTYSTGGNVTTLKPGFYFTPATYWLSGAPSCLINVEIKVPIIYQPTVI